MNMGVGPEAVQAALVIMGVVVVFFFWEAIAGFIGSILETIGPFPLIMGGTVVLLNYIVRSGVIYIPIIHDDHTMSTGSLTIPSVLGSGEFWIQVGLMMFVFPFIVTRLFGRDTAIALVILYAVYLLVAFALA